MSREIQDSEFADAANTAVHSQEPPFSWKQDIKLIKPGMKLAGKALVMTLGNGEVSCGRSENTVEHEEGRQGDCGT